MLQKCSSSTEFVTLSDEQYRALERERENEKFYRNHWKGANAPERAVERIASGQFSGDEWHKANRKLETLLKPRAGVLVALVGNRGPGKTQLAVCALDRACRAGQGVLYVKALDFFAEIRATYGAKTTESERDVIKRFCRPRLLVIDAIEERGETPAENRQLSHLIDRRYDDLTNTILIANLKADEFEKSIGASATSRLHECGGIIACEWPSFRV